ncbi:hypothetical protein JAAARDRAFT_199334 [Jaapia argillacea MUCL 33604]|uniref:Uncharacterized protein n=1 Tax=Jaapia argillacea MUCL 33604 TaxID=933084 RepID=A0A067PBA4_9AGAM|nr:hypothetical protein JAAARDRAFT_199334 [Jaapia argillacea MUCL 33604]
MLTLAQTLRSIHQDIRRNVVDFWDNLPQYLWMWFELTVCSALILLSYLLSVSLAGRKLHIGRVRFRLYPFAICFYDLRYSQDASRKFPTNVELTIESTNVELTFHIPRPSYPCWGTFLAENVYHRTPECSVSVIRCHTTLWIYPYAFRFTAGPYADTKLDDFRLQVFSSKRTPGWVNRLRTNLVATILKGDTIRCDEFRIAIQGGLNSPGERGVEVEQDGDYETTDAPEESVTLGGGQIGDGTGGEAVYKETYADSSRTPISSLNASDPTMQNSSGTSEFRTSTTARGYHVHNWQNRIYTFGSIDAQLRKNWEEEKGSYAMVVRDVRWTKVHSLYQRAGGPISAFPQIIWSTLQFPMSLFNAYRDPISMLNIHMTRLDVTFSEYRIQDAELLRQGAKMIGEFEWLNGGVMGRVGWDMLAWIIKPD